MFSKKVATALGVIAVLSGFAGGVVAFEARYAKNMELAQVKQTVQQMKLDTYARNLQVRMWDLERYYGIDKAKNLREYKELKADREKILQKLQR